MKAGLLILALIAVFVAPPVFGQAVNREKDADDWHFYISPHLFGIHISGTAAMTSPVGDPVELPIGVRLRDMADNLDWALAGLIQVKKGKWAFAADLSHSELSGKQFVPLPTEGPSQAEVETKVTIDEHELFVGYQLNDGNPFSEIIFGVRYINQDIELCVQAGPEELNQSIGDSWWRPFIGLRYYGPHNETTKWSPILRADVGGFDRASALTWRADLGMAYLFAKHWDLSLRYKWMGVNYKKCEAGDVDYYRYDALEHGFMLGIGIRF